MIIIPGPLQSCLFSFLSSPQQHLRTKGSLQYPKQASHGTIRNIYGKAHKCTQIRNKSSIVSCFRPVQICGGSRAVHASLGSKRASSPEPVQRGADAQAGQQTRAPSGRRAALGRKNGRPVARPFCVALSGSSLSSGRARLAPAKY